MSTAHEREAAALREAALRRALLSAAEQIEPAPGGFERIQARLRRPRPVGVAWLSALWTTLTMRAPEVSDALGVHAAHALRLVRERFGPRPAHRAPNRLSWLRPLAATTVAVFVLGAGVYVALDTPAFMGGIDSNSQSGLQPGGGSSTGAGGRTEGSGSPRPSQTGGDNTSGAAVSPTTCPKGPSKFTSSPGPTGPTFSSGPSSSAPTSPSPSPSPSSTTSPAGGGSSTPAVGSAADTPGAPASDQANGTDDTAAGDGSAATEAANGKTAKSVKSSRSTSKGGPASNSSKYSDCPTSSPKPKRHHTASQPAASGALQVSITLTGSAKLD
jgi:hypothetical protein